MIESKIEAIHLGLKATKEQGIQHILLISDNPTCIEELDCYKIGLMWNLRSNIHRTNKTNSFKFYKCVFAPRDFITAAYFLTVKARNNISLIIDKVEHFDSFCNSSSEPDLSTFLSKSLTYIRNSCKY